jgi:hypothetical protein
MTPAQEVENKEGIRRETETAVLLDVQERRQGLLAVVV